MSETRAEQTPVCGKPIGEFVCVARHTGKKGHRMVHKDKVQYYTETDGYLTSNLPPEYPAPPVNLYNTRTRVRWEGVMGLGCLAISAGFIGTLTFIVCEWFMG